MAEITCSRCGQKKEAVQNTAFYRGEIREKLLAHVCQDCWGDWIKMQIMLINEYRLNLMDPNTDEFLNKQILTFFKLDESGEMANVDFVPPAQ